MTSQPFDVVTVPDFSGPQARQFELRALFFLAFWLENGGKCRNFPLHLVCIGTPPESVRRLADQAGAHVTIQPPIQLDISNTINKLRGFEVEPRTGHLLLLDTDIMVLADFSDLIELQGCVAAAPAHRDKNKTDAYWSELYTLLKIEPPHERIVSLHQRLNPITGPATMWPYYNGGIIFMPWDCELPRLWTDYGHRIAKLFQNKPEKVRSRVKSDMVSLAIAIERLKQQGACFKPLPDHLHGHWMHLQGGLLSLEKIKLFHATNMFQPAYNTLEATRQFLCFGPGWIYQNLRWELDKRANRQCYRWKERRQNLLQVISSIVKLAYLRQKLYNKYIRAALDNGYR